MYRHRYKYIAVLWDPLWVFETVVFQNDFEEDFGVFLGKIQDAGLFETSHRHNHKSLGVLKKIRLRWCYKVGPYRPYHPYQF